MNKIGQVIAGVIGYVSWAISLYQLWSYNFIILIISDIKDSFKRGITLQSRTLIRID